MRQKEKNAEEQSNSEEEDEEDSRVQLDKKSGLANYFKEIVANANKYGDKIDLNSYKNLVSEYESMQTQRAQPTPTEDLEQEVRGNLIESKRRKQYSANLKPTSRN